MVRSARRRLISFLPLSVTVQERPCGGVNCHFTRRYGDLEARDSNFRSKNVGRFVSSHALSRIVCYQPTGKLYGAINTFRPECWTTMDGD